MFDLTDEEYLIWALHECQGVTFKELGKLFGRGQGTMHAWFKKAQAKILGACDVDTTTGPSPEDCQTPDEGPGG